MRDCFILGAGRSGTSMLAGSLASCGYHFGGAIYAPRAANAKGFFECRRINRLNEQLMAGQVNFRSWLSSRLVSSKTPGPGHGWLAKFPLNAVVEASPSLAAEIQRLVGKSGFCYKDPRFSYTLKPWRECARHAACICVFREPLATATSIMRECREARYLRKLQFKFEDALEVWHRMYSYILKEHVATGDWLFLHFDQIVSGSAMARISELLGVMPDSDFADPRLSRTRVIREPLSAEIETVYRELCRRAGVD